MTQSATIADAVIIGGGFYGSAIAIYLAKQRGFQNVILLESEPNLLNRASYNNQARVHNGYHYPRSFTTAFRSRINLPRFVRDWPTAIKKDFSKLYAIARNNSKVNSKQFEKFCAEIGAPLKTANPAEHKLFDSRLIENVFQVEEYAFDANKLALWAERDLRENDVKVNLRTTATGIFQTSENLLLVTNVKNNSNSDAIKCRYVFNCTYSGLNQITGDYSGTKSGLKHELTEMALIQAPPELEDVGVTVMDGPFFSIMPFPARGLHTLSHVRYTPHFSWNDDRAINPYAQLVEYHRNSRVDRMLRDVGRYMPIANKAKYIESLFEVKTILVKNEGDDGRPILFERNSELPGCYSILGGKIDNIYDVLEKLESEQLNVTGNV